jgi:PA14 domain
LKNLVARALGSGTLLAALFFLPTQLIAQSDSSDAFGDSIPISNGLMGKIYILPDTTKHLPNFDSLKPLPDFIYTKSIDVSPRSWSAGFPGLRDRFEWFGIEYIGTFRALKAGKYAFRLLSDDGSKLYVDGKLVINNDGLHGTSNEDAKLELDDSLHTIKIDYFQGPRYGIALQLFWTVGDAKEELFPGTGFILHAPPQPPPFPWWIVILAAILLLLLGIFLIWKKKKK